MNHVVDVVAHAVLRGAAYRLVWHAPPLLLLLLVGVVVVYLARRYP